MLLFFGLELLLAIPSGFGRSRIRRNCGYTLLYFRYFLNSFNKDFYLTSTILFISEIIFNPINFASL